MEFATRTKLRLGEPRVLTRVCERSERAAARCAYQIDAAENLPWMAPVSDAFLCDKTTLISPDRGRVARQRSKIIIEKAKTSGFTNNLSSKNVNSDLRVLESPLIKFQ